MPRVAAGVALAIAMAVAGPAAACPDGTDTARIDAILARQAHKAKVWDNAWAVTFGAAALVQGGMGLAQWVPGRAFDDAARAGVWVGASKAAIGSISHLILRLKIVQGGDPCRALAESRKHEKTTFFLNHAGGLALNLGGLLLLGLAFDSWKEGVLSFALGYPVGLLSVYTEPRGAWHATVVRAPDYTGLAIAGRF